MTETDYISTKQAREDLGDKGYFKLRKWLRDKGINNLTKVGDDKYVDEVFITKEQLYRFVKEQLGASRSDSLIDLFGQTREFLSRKKR